MDEKKSIEDLWDQFIKKLIKEKEVYRGSVKIDLNKDAYFTKDKDQISTMEKVIRICRSYDTHLIEDKESFKKSLAFLLDHGSVLPYLIRPIKGINDDKYSEKTILYNIKNAINNLEPVYAALFIKTKDDIIPANFYKVWHGLGIEKDTEGTQEALLSVAGKDFGDDFVKDEWIFAKGIFANGAIQTTKDHKTYIYELLSKEDMYSIGQVDAAYLLKEGKLPLKIKLPFKREVLS